RVLSTAPAQRRTTRLADTVRFCRRNPLVLVGASVVFIWIIASIAAPLISPYGPLTQRVVERLQAPTPTHPFGTDALGRDILSRVLFGGRISLPVGLAVVVSALLLGGTVGAVAGVGAGWLDTLLMRGTAKVMALSTIILAINVAAHISAGRH